MREEPVVKFLRLVCRYPTAMSFIGITGETDIPTLSLDGIHEELTFRNRHNGIFCPMEDPDWQFSQLFGTRANACPTDRRNRRKPFRRCERHVPSAVTSHA